jgi:hypothetical protein
MKINTINLVVDCISFVLLLGLVLSGFVLEAMPHGPGRGQGWQGGRQVIESQQPAQLWSLSRHDWHEVHVLIGFSFALIMLVHILLHWKWITCWFKSSNNLPHD